MPLSIGVLLLRFLLWQNVPSSNGYVQHKDELCHKAKVVTTMTSVSFSGLPSHQTSTKLKLLWVL